MKKNKLGELLANLLIPGLNIKRWFLFFFLGFFIFSFSVILYLDIAYFDFFYNNILILFLNKNLVLILILILFIIIGFILMMFSLYYFYTRIVDIISPDKDKRLENVFKKAYNKHKLEKGPKIVAIGGGTGLSTILRGLKKKTSNLTAVVTVSDDGGSSGKLIKLFNIPAPGDVRNCLVALSNPKSELMEKLLQYRFQEGESLKGHSFGNLFLIALYKITGSFLGAIDAVSKILNIRGRVIPGTLNLVKLCAEFQDGKIIEGETSIRAYKGKIKRVFLKPVEEIEEITATDLVKELILGADVIVLGPGSLYTSILPNLLIKDITNSIKESRAVKVFIVNVMTEKGETDNFKASDHLRIIKEITNIDIDFALVNDSEALHLEKEVLDAYKVEEAEIVEADIKEIEKMNIKVIKDKFYKVSDNKVLRHDYDRIAEVIYALSELYVKG